MQSDHNPSGGRPDDQRFQELIDHLPLVVWAHDASGAQQFVNQTFCDFFGVAREAMEDSNWTLFTHPDDGDGYERDFVDAIEGQRPFHNEVRVKAADGSWRLLESWATPRFDDQGTYLGHIGTSADVTDRRAAERALADTAEFTARVLDNLFTFAGVLDRDGVVIAANRAPLEVAGIDLADVVGRPFWECFWWTYDPDVSAELEGACARAIKGELVRYDVEVRSANDGRVPIDFQVAPIRDSQGQVSHLVVSGLDLTERIVAEATERSARRRSEVLESVATGLAAAGTVEAVADTTVDTLFSIGVGGARFWTLHDGTMSATVYRGSVSGEATLREPVIASDGGVVGMVEVWGDLSLGRDDQGSSLLKAIGGQVAGALERAISHERERRARAKAEIVTALLVDIEQAAGVLEQIDLLATSLVPRVADVVIVEVPAEDDPLRALAHIDPDQAITVSTKRRWKRRQAAEAGRTDPRSLATVAVGEPRLLTRQGAVGEQNDTLLDDLGFHSMLACPISLGGGRQGVLLCGLVDPERRPYNQNDLEFIRDLAVRIGAVINATRAREQEHESSLRLQRALLPEAMVEHDSIDVAARYQAASDQLEVGGDWYDSILWSSGEYGIVVGDVVGHGIEAAAAMGRLRAGSGILFASGPPDPVVMLETLDQLAGGPEGTDYLTAFCVVIDPATGVARYASAGHPPGFVVGADGTMRWLDEATSPPICPLFVASRPSGQITLHPDDTLVLYSDGLVERRDANLPEAIRHLGDQVRDRVHLDIEHLNQQLVASMPQPAEDDIVIISLRFAPTGNQFRESIPARQSEIGPLRSRLAAWLDGQGISEEARERVVLGTSEACSNAVEHGYAQLRTGRVSVRATERAGSVQVIITDAGVWNERVNRLPHRGRGTHIMETVTRSFERLTSSTGTTVTLTF